ncbi:formylglycine-generating enzyme family protein [Sphingomonas sp. 28-63-12]|uniref:formylglycine-generating enzyme family protein n=1 Tax=Sphingomonas sp. 28-63-12 TaxID=1970434 RepID=UPI0035A82E0D
MADHFVTIASGRYQRGSDRHYPEERPAVTMRLPGFALAVTPVSNADFARFVSATGHVTQAESAGRPGSAVFLPTDGPVDLTTPCWWHFVDGACWHAPEGPGSSINHRQDHPVVHVAQADAQAYARWADARLPSEAEWEAGARAGLADADYAWGDELMPDGRLMANIWTGSFPWYFARGARAGTSAIGSFPAIGNGLYDMIGNVWEWTSTPARPGATPERGCCAPDAGDAGDAGDDRLIITKGGSFLCAAEYCQRYRPAARIAVTASMTSAHIGFRLARDGQPGD